MARLGAAPSRGAKESGGATATSAHSDQTTDHSKWRLLNEQGRHRWRYLDTDEEVKEWPQSSAEKWYLGLDTEAPKLRTPKTPLESINNGLSFFSRLQLGAGNWGCEYGGPMFLLPGLVIALYVTQSVILESYRIEMRNYLYARAHPDDGGWGLHIEGESTVFGTTMNYVALRLLGADAEDSRLVKARGTLHKLGGALYGPHWAKFWLAVLGVVPWNLVNPVPPELWLLPDWVPIAPWRWWIHMRQVFLPMSFAYSKQWSYKPDETVLQLRQELFTQPYESIDFFTHRNSISAKDNYHPKTWVLNLVNWFLVYIWTPYLRPNNLKKQSEEWAWELIKREDENTDFSNLGPVNAAMNLLCCYIQQGPDSYSVRRHRERVDDFLWVKDEGMLMNGTNGVQNWDTAFTIQAVVEAGLSEDPKWKPMLLKALEYLQHSQIEDDCNEQAVCYRHTRKGAWGFSNKDQGYTVSDCTAEGLKAVLMLQNAHGYPKLIPEERITDAIDVLLTMQNPSGGCSSYEPTRGSEYLEWLNAAEVFGRIMVEYDYPECTTAVTTALVMFSKYYPDYRREEIKAFTGRCITYVRRDQRSDGSWFGSWGICFTYAGMFALESLATAGETYENSERVRRACKFFLDRQMEDGGWGESYRSCETGVYVPHEKSQVVQTAWVCIALMEAKYTDHKPLKKALSMIVSRQQPNGEWLQEAIEGVFNKSCMISYPNYKFIFPIKALGMYASRFGNDPIHGTPYVR